MSIDDIKTVDEVNEEYKALLEKSMEQTDAVIKIADESLNHWKRCESALKDIRGIADEYLNGCSKSAIEMTPYMNSFLQIKNKVNEVLHG
jgi:hypothetical protein